MHARALRCTWLLLAPAAVSLGCNPDPSAASAPGGEPEPISTTLFTDKIELFVEYPPLVAGRPARFLVHLSVLSDGAPVRSGDFTLAARRGDAPPLTVSLAAPKRDGLYTPEAIFPAAGEYTARITLHGPQATDQIILGTLTVYANDAALNAALAAQPAESDPPDAVPFLMEQQWKIGMLLSAAVERSLVERLTCTGEVVAPPERIAIISTPVAGRLRAPGTGPLPRLGDIVQSGQLLAVIEPAKPLLTETATYALELRTRAVEIQRDVDDSRAQLQYAQREYDRLSALEKAEASSSREVYEAERNLALARSQHAAAAAMQARYDAAAEQLDVYRQAAQTPGSSRAADDPLRIPLTAPIKGQIAAAAHAEGELLHEEDELYTVVDLERVWVVAHVSEFDLPRLPPRPNAVIAPTAEPDRRIDVQAVGGSLVHFGSMVDPHPRTVALHYEVPNGDGRLRAGMLATVALETARSLQAVAIPEEAVVMENGAPIAFVLHGGELFEKRELALGIRDNGLVEVVRGVSAGERVVSRGAYAVKLSALSGASFGPAHVH